MIRVLRDWKRIDIREVQMKKTDIFIKRVEKNLEEDLKTIEKQMSEELDNMTIQELRDVYKDKAWKKAFNWWSIEKLIEKIEDLKDNE